MKYKPRFTLLLLMITGIFLTLHAQVEEVALRENYTHQVFYNLETREQTEVPNTAWHIAFSAAGLQDAGIFINESTAVEGQNPLKLFKAQIGDWSQPIASTDGYTDDLRLYNPDKSWTFGAFNVGADPSDFTDYGWGVYDQQTSVVGDEIFVLQLRDGSWIKLEIVVLDALEYRFRTANLDNSNERNFSLSKTVADGGMPLIHFNLLTGDVLDLPDQYHLIFQRYNSQAEEMGQILDYDVTGVLLAPNVQGLKVEGVDPLAVMGQSYASQLKTDVDEIGFLWKRYDFNDGGWWIQDDHAYFVSGEGQDANTIFEKIVFYDFEGQSTGVITFEQWEQSLSSYNEYASDNEIKMWTPTVHLPGDIIEVQILDESDDGAVMLIDMQGSIIRQQEVKIGEHVVRVRAPHAAGRYQIIYKETDGQIHSLPIVIQ